MDGQQCVRKFNPSQSRVALLVAALRPRYGKHRGDELSSGMRSRKDRLERLDLCNGELNLHSATHNLKKLHSKCVLMRQKGGKWLHRGRSSRFQWDETGLMDAGGGSHADLAGHLGHSTTGSKGKKSNKWWVLQLHQKNINACFMLNQHACPA
ncbi:MAG: hypothetical protein HQL96_08100 [Magnetococcales bacterium]|nr:hypothetical protein [Magnetococcales bacterium]